MKYLTAVLSIAVISLSACREEVAALPDPIPLSADAAGYYCQMNLLEHEGPKAQIHLDGLPAPIFFSQVRDAIAYQRMPEQSHAIVAVYVQDMARAASWADPGADNWMNIDDAIFVLGGDVIGGMGAPEIVPFSERSAAEAFVSDHGGRVVTLDQVTDADVLTAASPEAAPDDTDIGARLKKLSSPIGGKS